ncbi:molybdopterin synthase catalytic subunit MoaE [Chitinimonas taiwanensis]|uniref:Molybdopterin synthase catalytic subunit n=1 Tax=Chitinimonas taiwanensis DSM 18899 TaxID=1121279 RepID=A0A1K2HCL2_9NEIS|nr:molybdopterin synthase catalytic subunit MoaE [Chitinimonas taiwanensis]SFZ74405.1 molybdopterin synthase catalytic subunit [Chitinimonas taiwanensis DSM 18899]
MDKLPQARIAISVQTEDFDLGHEADVLSAGDRGIGAMVSFVGLVRDLNLAEDVVALELEHYPGMTEKALLGIAEEAAVRWPLNAVRIVHRVGRLHPGERIVLVLTASPHRHAAYEANTFIMDFLKTRAPFWKKEWTPDGPRWVEARDSDLSAAARWHQVVSKQYGNTDHD